jgi:transposase InsO family protein
VLDDFSRYIVAWKLCATMRASDVIKTLDRTLAASGPDQVKVVHRPRLLSDNGTLLRRRRSGRVARPAHCDQDSGNHPKAVKPKCRIVKRNPCARDILLKQV